MIDLPTKKAYEMGVDIIRQSGIFNEKNQDNTPENMSRQENIDQLINGMHDFCAQRMEEGDTNISLIDFLSEVALLTDQDSDKAGDEKKVTMMTIHAAKGLEVPNVFVVGMEENLFPGSLSSVSFATMEEERRLFYVAITRAEKNCFLSFAKSRMRYGKTDLTSPSRFLRDIDTCFLDLPEEMKEVRQEIPSFRSSSPATSSFRPRSSVSEPKNETRNLRRITPSVKPSNPQSASGSAPVGDLQIGQMIEHERFGIGEVMKLEGEGDNRKATIHFRNAGDKQLLLRFARFKIVD